MIQTENLRKEFTERGGKTIVAVRNLNLRVNKGEIFGLLGPNAAGKTTTVKMLCTLLVPTSGKAYVDGFDCRKEDYEVRKRINVVLGPLMNYHRMTGRDNLKFYGKLYEVNKLDQKIDELAEFFEMEKRLEELVETYSTGLKCRLALMRGMINDPEVLFLDEPTLGLDPSISLKLRGLMRELNDEGKTIFLCTHYMLEAEQLCHRVAIINKGSIVAEGSPKILSKKIPHEDFLVVETKNPPTEKQIKKFGMEKRQIMGMTPEEKRILKIPIRDTTHLQELLLIVNKNLPKITDIRIERPSLEEVFQHYTHQD